MPVWRCPHCATPQAEASRCWVCHRSTTSCVTCRHYRRGISGGLGLCGLDPRHPAVADTDVKACWVGAPAVAAELAAATSRRGAAEAAPGSGAGRAPRTFVPVEELVTARERTAVAVMERVELAIDLGDELVAEPVAQPTTEPVTVPVMTPAAPTRPVPGRWWLWGDPDPWPERVGERWT